MKVKVGQIWFIPGWKERYHITRLERDGKFISVWSDIIRNETVVGTCRFGYANDDGSPAWNVDGWVCESPEEKTFSKLGKKTLRKRVRDQMAAQLLMERK